MKSPGRLVVVGTVVVTLLSLLCSCGATNPADTARETVPTSAPTATAVPATPIPTPTPTAVPTPVPPPVVRPGAAVLADDDFALLHGKRVGLIAHRASTVDGSHLSVLLNDHPEVTLAALFAPEHGLYGAAAEGEVVDDAVDPATGVAVLSLYGPNRAPDPATLAELDVLVYDLQDVGTRFYTYTSTLGLAMQAAAEANVAFVVTDRPNPLGGDTLQGPTLRPGLESFIGLYQVPSAYGLTAGELAQWIKTDDVLPGLDNLDLTVVAMDDWDPAMRWHDNGLVWEPPSPNLRTADAALLYPGTVLFEATSISEGRGTDTPFQLIGAPWLDADSLAADLNSRGLSGVVFEPADNAVFIGVVAPSQVAGLAVGLHLLDVILDQAEAAGTDRSAIIDRPEVFDRLAGDPAVRLHLIADLAVDDLLASFDQDHAAFAALTEAALLYPR